MYKIMPITASTTLKLDCGDFMVSFFKNKGKECLLFSYGDLANKEPVIRMHSACLFGESFLSKHCDCRQQLVETLKLIRKNKSGVITYTYSEGRGIGIENKIKAMNIERAEKVDTVAAFLKLGFEVDLRNYGCEIEALKELGIKKEIFVVSNNPRKIDALIEAGFTIKKIIKLKIALNKYNKGELMVKKNKMGYYID